VSPVTRVTPDDVRFMRRALQLAARGRGRVEPNPMVGCVIVRNGRIIGEAYHRRFGGPHAESEALRRGADGTRGATVYVSLEPCCFQGKTPPCSEALLDAGVREVVAALRDPNPRVAGRGLRRLKDAGIAVRCGVLEDEARALNAPFVKLMRAHRPWVILKWAQSLDGKIATHSGDSKWITDDVQRAHAQRLRSFVDAIMVGARTVLADDPLLTYRLGRPWRVATRIVLDAQLSVPPTVRLVRTARRVPTWFFCTRRVPRERIQRLEAAGCVVHRVAEESSSRGARVSLPAVLDVLGAVEMSNVLVEGGGTLLGGFFDQRLLDEVDVYIAPRLIGGQTAIGALHGRGAARLGEALWLWPTPTVRRLGTGWWLQARVK